MAQGQCSAKARTVETQKGFAVPSQCARAILYGTAVGDKSLPPLRQRAMDSCVRVCEEALNITTMAMSSDRRRSSAIDYTDVYRVFPEDTENAHQLVEWDGCTYNLISRLDGLGPRLP